MPHLRQHSNSLMGKKNEKYMGFSEIPNYILTLVAQISELAKNTACSPQHIKIE